MESSWLDDVKPATIYMYVYIQPHTRQGQQGRSAFKRSECVCICGS